MAKPPTEFMEKYNIDSDEVWEVRAGGAWAVKHSALERVAAEQKIIFDRPSVIEANSANKIAVVCVFAKMGDREEWSFGEASPANNKNQYCYAMAEKRAKDRCILKLLNSHGAVYSDAEADDFAQSNGDGKITTLPKKDAKPVYVKLQSEIDQLNTREAAMAWGKENKDRIGILPDDWCDILRLRFEEKLGELRQKEAA